MVNSVSFVAICSASLSGLAMAQYGNYPSAGYGYAPSTYGNAPPAGYGYGAQAYHPSGSFSVENAQAHANSDEIAKRKRSDTLSFRSVHDYTKSANENHTKLNQETDKLEETKEKYNNADKYANAKYYGYPRRYGGAYRDQYSYEYGNAPHQSGGYAPHQSGYGSRAYPSGYYGAKAQAHANDHHISKNTKTQTWSDLDVNDHTTTVNENLTKSDEVTLKAEEIAAKYNNRNTYQKARAIQKKYGQKQSGGYVPSPHAQSPYVQAAP